MKVILARSIAAVALFWLAAPQTGRGPAGVAPIAPYNAGSEPACDQSRRGSLIVVLGGSGQPDNLEVCLRDGAGRFAWTSASAQNRNTFAHTRMIGGCPLFPDNNVWNSTIDKLPVTADSAGIIRTYATARLGSNPEYPLNLANSKTPAGPVQFDASGESDQGRWPVTGSTKMESPNRESPVSAAPFPNSDSHVFVIQTDECKLYEIFGLSTGKPPYRAGSGAIYDLMSNSLRPNGWTSADAAGLPIWPGVLTYAELYGGGDIPHMIRFTVNRSRAAAVWPARHFASHSGDATLPPMGSRWRLTAATDDNVCRQGENNGRPYPQEMKKLIRALKRHGMILGDNGSAIRISTDTDARWGTPGSNTSVEYVFQGWTHCLTGKDFEVVDASLLTVNPDSGEVLGQ